MFLVCDCVAGNGIYCCIGRSRLERYDDEVGVKVLDYSPLGDLELLASNEFLHIVPYSLLDELCLTFCLFNLTFFPYILSHLCH